MSGRRSNGGGASLQLRKRKKTMAEVVNESMTHELSGGRGKGAAHDPFLDGEEGDMGIAEDYEWGNADDDFDHDGADDVTGTGERNSGASSSALAGKKRARSGTMRERENKLRRRGPLDPSLSEGKYAAQPVANVEAMMDDIFGDLDMGDLDAEGEEVVYGADEGETDHEEDEGDDEEEDGHAVGDGRRAGKKAKKAKDLSEEEYMAFLAEKRKKRAAVLRGSGLTSLGAVDGEEGAILEQLQNLRQAQVSLVKGVADKGEEESKIEAATRAKTQEAVKHYIMLHAHLLRIRVKLQPAVIKAVSMPQYYARHLFTEPQDALIEGAGEEEKEEAGDPEDISEAYDAVVSELQELLATLYGLTHTSSPDTASTAAAAGRGSSSPAVAGALPVPSFAAVQKYHTQQVKKKADACLAYWGSKLVRTNSAKLKTISQPLPQQIEAILANMPRLRRKVQKNRAHLPVFAHPDHERAAAAAAAAKATSTTSADKSENAREEVEEAVKERNGEATMRRAAAMADGDVDEEIYDDSDFLRELVRRGGAAAHRLEQQLAEINKQALPAKEAKRKGFHKLTKGKELNYEPRPKLVGFLMAEGFEGSGRNDILFKSLFQ